MNDEGMLRDGSLDRIAKNRNMEPQGRHTRLNVDMHYLGKRLDKHFHIYRGSTLRLFGGAYINSGYIAASEQNKLCPRNMEQCGGGEDGG